jgi:hypothetical protein
MIYRFFALCVIVLVSACGGSGSDNVGLPQQRGPTAVIFISAPPATLAVDAATTVSASAIFPTGVVGGNTAITWSVSCGSSGACGAFSASDNAGAQTYTAPSQIPAGKTVTITATSVANPSLSIGSVVTIVGPIPIVVSFAATPPASIQVGASIGLTATALNDVSANPELTWTVGCGSAACGFFQSTTTASGTASTYTAPASIPSGAAVTITATSVTDKTKSASAQIVVTAMGPTLANGTYVFQIAGQPGNQANFTTGVFTANNGQITGGEQDSIAYTALDDNGDAYGYPIFQTITGGSYATTADGNLQISIAIGPDEVETLAGTLGAGAQGFVSGFNGASATGSLDLQSSISPPSGGYALSLFGGDGMQGPTWLAGVVNVDGPGAISGAGSILDVVDSGAQQGGTYTLGAGSVSVPDSLGRVQIQLLPIPSTLQPITLAGYVVDATHMRVVGSGDTSNPDNYQGVLGGLALGQGAGTGQFSATAVAGTNYVFGAQGADAQGNLQIAGVVTLGVNGSASGTLNWNDLTGKEAQAPLPFTGTYAVDSTGRVTLTQLTDSSSFSYGIHLYLAAGGNALLLSNDTSDSFDGQAFQQQTGGFTAASFSGVYGMNLTRFSPNNGAFGLQEWPAIGTITAVAGASADTASGFADAANGLADFAVGGTVNAQPSGIFGATLTGFAPGSPVTPGSFTLYVVDGTRAVLIETDSNALTLGNLQILP